MKLLILGGTQFVGRHIVNVARERKHDVTLFNRGRTNPGLFDGVEELHGDRDGDLSALEGREWDAVIDTSGYVPRVVRDSARLLVDHVDHYTFISTISVYDDMAETGINEASPLAMMEDNSIEKITGETYGPLKVLCEQVVQETYPGRSLVIRPGLIVGPNDPTDRFTYWPVRVSRGGQVLAPGNAGNPVQFIDVRDLAAWTVRMVEKGATGIYNATGPDEILRMGDLLETCREVAGSQAKFVWVDEGFLLAHDVGPFVEMPLWIPGAEGAGFGTVNVSKAVNAGLRFRPVAETVGDTLDWVETWDDDHEWRAGLDPQREAALLQEWYDDQENTDDGFEDDPYH